jgi:methenyltetrahydromethanopterin cyclohydrolase
MNEKISVNRLAMRLLDELIEKPDFYRVQIEKTESGVTIVDAGIHAKGGFETGRLVTEICMGGCAKTEVTSRIYGNMELPSILVYTDHPVIATLGSQYAGWQISEEGYFAIGSGPARALALKPREIYEEINYKDDSDRTVVVLETDKPPPARIVEQIARDCQISPQELTIILTPTASIAGATQVCGRIVETGIHKLRKTGLDPNVILYAFGCAPIPPIHPKFADAMARTNDAILYGGTVYYVVEHDDEETLQNIVSRAASNASKDYGKPFIEIFKAANYDFYKIDPQIFAPACVMINNIRTGKVVKSGRINSDVLSRSFQL